VAGLDVLAAAASALLWWRTRPIYQREYLLVRLLLAQTLVPRTLTLSLTCSLSAPCLSLS